MLRTDSDITSGQGRVLFLDPQRNLHVMLSYRDYMQHDPLQLRKWVETFPPNLPVTFGFLQAGGYDPVAMQSTKQAVRELAQQLPLQENQKVAGETSSEYSSRLGRISVKYLVTFSAQPLRPTRGMSPVFTSDWQQDGLRVRVYRNDNFIARLQSPAAPWQEQSPNQLQVELLPTVGQRTVTLRDTAYPAWHAYLGGQRVPVGRTADGYRAIMPAPHSVRTLSTPHKVALVYDLNSFRVGLFCALLAVSLLSAHLISIYLARRGPQGGASTQKPYTQSSRQK
jgi:hypothetical protein